MGSDSERIEKAAAFEAMLRRKRMRLVLILLLILLAALAFAFLSYLRSKEVPLPRVTDVNEEQIAPPTFMFVFDGSAKHRLNKPVGVAIHPTSGNIYVSDTYNSRISVFDPQGRYLFSFNKIGQYGTLFRPLYFAFDDKDQVYVTDRKRPGIWVFNEGGKFIRKLIPNGDETFEWLPIAMKFASNGDLLVTDVRRVHRVLILDKNGRIKLTFGKSGQVDKMLEDPGLFAYPNSIDIDPKGNVVIADSNNRRLQIYSTTGKFIKLIDVGGIPRGIKFGYKNRLHIADVVGHNTLVYNDGYKHLVTFAEQGQNLGQLMFPTGLDVKGRRIYIADTENDRIEVWSWGVEIAVPGQVAQGLDLMKLIGPLALLALLLWARRRKYVADASFLQLIDDLDELHWAKDKLKKVRVTEAVYERFKNVEQEGRRMDAFMKTWRPKRDLVDRLIDDFAISLEQSEVIALAKGRLFKPWLISQDADVRTVALSLGLKTFAYEDIKGTDDTRRPEKAAGKDDNKIT